jgi:hypothetical protein
MSPAQELGPELAEVMDLLLGRPGVFPASGEATAAAMALLERGPQPQSHRRRRRGTAGGKARAMRPVTSTGDIEQDGNGVEGACSGESGAPAGDADDRGAFEGQTSPWRTAGDGELPPRSAGDRPSPRPKAGRADLQVVGKAAAGYAASMEWDTQRKGSRADMRRALQRLSPEQRDVLLPQVRQ